MNRREALAALVALPATTRISVAQLKPEDVIVIECDRHLSHAEMEKIQTQLSHVWLGHKVVILDADLKLKIAPVGLA